jgi:hypothetical protein
VIILFIFYSFYFISHTSNSFKNKALETIGSKNILDTKVKITDIFIRYSFFFDKSISFPALYNTIWTPEFNSTDPESSWGVRNHKQIFPLTGRNVEIVPKEAKGYLLDSTTNSYHTDNYCDAYSLLVDLNVNTGDKYRASVYCFASQDFDGDIARLTVGTDCIIERKVFGQPVALYNLNEKGIWRKLEIDFECISGKVPIYISLVKKGVADLSDLKGYIIFAYPEFKKLEKNDSTLSESYFQNRDNIEYINSNISENQSHKENLISAKNLLWKGAKYSDDQNYTFLESHYSRLLTSSGFFDITGSIASLQLSSSITQDPIRRLANNLISEDTTYHGYKSALNVDTTLNKYGDERVVRWLFAIQIFSKEFNWKQKIFGGGFNFLNWYGYYFLKDKTQSDWPHNPFLSILLYSGILGLCVYCFLLYRVVYIYLKYLKEYPLLFIFFLITFFFSFFSGGSPFDPPIMGFFVILPFFIHSVCKGENQKLTDKQLTEEK